ncbi:MAG: hypothetical protein AAB911_01730 [Patescibacteria group bacterium]
MIKFLLYSVLFSIGGYYAIQALPSSFKEKTLAAIGFGSLKEKRDEVFNPAAVREEIIEKLQKNITSLKSANDTKLGGSSSSDINIEGPAEQQEIIKQSEELITELKELNPKTGVVPKILEKILGLQPQDQSPLTITNPQLQKLINQIPPEVKEQICKVQ